MANNEVRNRYMRQMMVTVDGCMAMTRYIAVAPASDDQYAAGARWQALKAWGSNWETVSWAVYEYDSCPVSPPLAEGTITRITEA